MHYSQTDLVVLVQFQSFEVVELSQVPQFHHRVLSSRSKVVAIGTSKLQYETEQEVQNANKYIRDTS